MADATRKSCTMLLGNAHTSTVSGDRDNVSTYLWACGTSGKAT